LDGSFIWLVRSLNKIDLVGALLFYRNARFKSLQTFAKVLKFFDSIFANLAAKPVAVANTKVRLYPFTLGVSPRIPLSITKSRAFIE